MIVTIDGPAASGKSTAARLLAQRLGVSYLDTGAMYRAVTWAAMDRGIPLDHEASLADLARELRIDLEPRPEGIRVLVNGRDVSAEVRANEVSRNARHAASNGLVRAHLVASQQRIGRQWGSLVTEGRDQGTVVFPAAEVKFYLDAADDVRAERRRQELAAKGQDVPLEEILQDLQRRDASDRNRQVGPLRVPDDAEVIDTSGLTIEEMVELLAELVASRMRES